jgi:hypothetical protein
MRVIEDERFDKDFPESFPWGEADRRNNVQSATRLIKNHAFP